VLLHEIASCVIVCILQISKQVADERLQQVLKNKGIMGLRLGLYLAASEGAVINAGDPVYAALL